jgi:hypothetical protein
VKIGGYPWLRNEAHSGGTGERGAAGTEQACVHEIDEDDALQENLSMSLSSRDRENCCVGQMIQTEEGPSWTWDQLEQSLKNRMSRHLWFQWDYPLGAIWK